MDGLIVDWCETRSVFLCVFMCVSVCVCVCACEQEDSGRWQPLSQAYRQTLSPPPTLKHSSLWHAQKCHELALSVCCVCVRVCEHVGLPAFVCLCATSNSSVQLRLYLVCNASVSRCVHENYVKYTAVALWLVSFVFLSFFSLFYYCSHVQIPNHINK